MSKSKKNFHHSTRTIVLSNAVYYKGCGPSVVKINGYSSSTRCGVDAPDEGKEVIVFACKKTKTDQDTKSGMVEWELNEYTNYAGQSMANQENLTKVIQILGNPKDCPNDNVVFDVCTPRGKDENESKFIPSIRNNLFSPTLEINETKKPENEANSLLEIKPIVTDEIPQISINDLSLIHI